MLHFDVDKIGRSRLDLETDKLVTGELCVFEAAIRFGFRCPFLYGYIPLFCGRRKRMINSWQARLLFQRYTSKLFFSH